MTKRKLKHTLEGRDEGLSLLVRTKLDVPGDDFLLRHRRFSGAIFSLRSREGRIGGVRAGLWRLLREVVKVGKSSSLNEVEEELAQVRQGEARGDVADANVGA